MALAQIVDLSGNDVVCNNILTGAATPGSLGTVKQGSLVRYALTGVNFNSASTDNQVAITLPSSIARYTVSSIILSNASASISTATVGVFTAAAAGGVTIAANQAITVTATAANTVNNAQSLTLTAATTTSFTSPTLFVRVGTAQGSAATADVVITLNVLT